LIGLEQKRTAITPSHRCRLEVLMCDFWWITFIVSLKLWLRRSTLTIFSTTYIRILATKISFIKSLCYEFSLFYFCLQPRKYLSLTKLVHTYIIHWCRLLKPSLFFSACLQYIIFRLWQQKFLHIKLLPTLAMVQIFDILLCSSLTLP